MWAFSGGTATFLSSSPTVDGDGHNVNGVVVFGASNQLWRSDGTASGTFSVANVSGNFNTGYIRANWPMAVAGNSVYFGASDDIHGFEPWKTDGSIANTSLIKDLDAAVYGSYPGSLRTLGNGALFTASSDYHDSGSATWDLWFSDGSEAGTQQLLANTGRLDGYAVCGDRAFFSHATATSPSELWSTDGTAAGTGLVKEIYTGTGSYPGYFACVDGIVYFSARSSSLDSWELWRSDGTENGTFLVAPFGASGTTGLSTPLYAFGHAIYFGVHTTSNAQLWRSDGTPVGTVMLKDLTGASSMNSQSVVAGTSLYFATYGSGGGETLWRSDGTTVGTTDVLTDATFISLYGNFYGRAILNDSAGLTATDGAANTVFDHIMLSGGWSFGVMPLNGNLYYNFPALRTWNGVSGASSTGIGDIQKLLGTAGGRLYASRYLTPVFIETEGTAALTILSKDVTQVASAGGHLFIAADELYAYDMPVAVTSFSPHSISSGGTAITISGRGFTGPVTLTVGGVASSVTGVTATSITFNAPSLAPGSYPIAFTLGDGREMTTDSPLTYTCAAPVAAIAPVSGVAEAFAPVTLTGSGGTTCMWFPAAGLDDASSCTTQAHVGRSTTYTLVVYSNTGCPSTNNPSVRVRVTPLPPWYVQAYPNGGSSISVSWPASDGATGYEVWRRHGLTDEKIATTSNTYITDSPVSYLDGYVYRVKAIGAEGTSASSTGDYSSTYSYATVAPAVGSEITAWTMTSLRGVIDMIRAGADLDPFAWSQSIVPGGTVIRAADVLEMRTALDEVAAALSVVSTSWTGTPATNGLIRASYIVQIRNATR